MKIFQQCVSNVCDLLRFRYEQQQSLFQRAYIQYTQCSQQQFNSLGLFSSDKSSGNSGKDTNVIGGGSIGDGSSNDNISVFSLSKNYQQIVQVYENCYSSFGRGLEELDSYKDCQINCLDKAIDTTENLQSSSTLSTNLILAIVFSVIGFAIAIFLIYKCNLIKNKPKGFVPQVDIEQPQGEVDNEDVDCYEEDFQKHLRKGAQYLSKKSGYKYFNGKRLGGGLQRLDVNKMKQIVNHLKQDQPDDNEVVVLSHEKLQNECKSNQFTFNHYDSNTKLSSRNNSQSFASRSMIPRQSKRRFTDQHKFEEDNTLPIPRQNQFITLGEGMLVDLRNSNLPSMKNTQRAQPTDHTQKIQNIDHPIIATVQCKEIDTNQQITSSAAQETQKNTTEKLSNSHDKTQQFACYSDLGVVFTSPCEATEKVPRILSPQSNSQRIIPFYAQNSSPQIVTKNVSYLKEIQSSPQVKISLETQENTSATPELLNQDKRQIKDQFELEENILPKSLQDTFASYSSSMNQCDTEEDEGINVIKTESQQVYQSTLKNQVKLHTLRKSCSLFEKDSHERDWQSQQS